MYTAAEKLIFLSGGPSPWAGHVTRIADVPDGLEPLERGTENGEIVCYLPTPRMRRLRPGVRAQVWRFAGTMDEYLHLETLDYFRAPNRAEQIEVSSPGLSRSSKPSDTRLILERWYKGVASRVSRFGSGNLLRRKVPR